ncbi:MAG: hypothetical protein K1V97_00720 [Lachnospiraceae bacterium]
MHELDVLTCIQTLCDGNLKCSTSDVSQKLNISEVELLPFFKELKNKSYISVYLGGEIQLHQKGVNAIEEATLKKKIENKKQVKKVFVNILKWLFGIIASVVGALIIWYLGLN